MTLILVATLALIVHKIVTDQRTLRALRTKVRAQEARGAMLRASNNCKERRIAALRRQLGEDAS